jgi:hypothetical protein
MSLREHHDRKMEGIMRKNLDPRASQFSVGTYSSSMSGERPGARLKFLPTKSCAMGFLSGPVRMSSAAWQPSQGHYGPCPRKFAVSSGPSHTFLLRTLAAVGNPPLQPTAV